MVYDDRNLKAASLYMGYQAYIAKMHVIWCFTASFSTVLFLVYTFQKALPFLGLLFRLVALAGGLSQKRVRFITEKTSIIYPHSASPTLFQLSIASVKQSHR